MAKFIIGWLLPGVFFGLAAQQGVGWGWFLIMIGLNVVGYIEGRMK